MLAVNENRIAAAVARLGSENAFEILARARRARSAQAGASCTWKSANPISIRPEHIKKAAAEALYDNHTHYTPSAGIPALRSTIAEYASRFRHISPVYTTENVVVAPGAKPVIWNILSALLDPGRRLHLFRSGVSGVRIVLELPAGQRACASRCSNRATGAWISTSWKAAFPTRPKPSSSTRRTIRPAAC